MTTFILGAIVGLCAWLLYFLLRWLQPRFWPPARRQERYRIRLRKTKDELRRDRVAEETSVASRLSAGERRALHRLTDAEVEEALPIPQTGSSLRAAGPSPTPSAEPSGESMVVRVDMGPTLPPTISILRTEAGSKSTKRPGLRSSSGNTGGPGIG